MFAWDIWIAFLGYAVPMVISPGPGNTLLATTGGRFGVKDSLTFWSGFEAGNLVLCLIYGLGLSRTLHLHPEIHPLLKWAGVAYLLYLAWGFLFSSAKAPESDETGLTPLGFWDGFLSVALNPKIHSMILVMFSQFLISGKSLFGQVILLTDAFLIVCVVCHFPWIYGGQLILGRFRSASALRLQGWIFGICMVLVAGYVAWV